MFSKILCPIDFSDFTAKQVAYAQGFAKFQNASITLLYVIEPMLQLYGYVSLAELDEKLLEIAQDKMSPFSKAGLNTKILRGSSAAEINLSTKKEEFDLIILPTHGNRGFKKLFFGSTFQGTINETNSCVLALPPRVFQRHNLDFVKPKQILCAIDPHRRSAKLCHVSKRLAEESDGVFSVLHSLNIQKEVMEFLNAQNVEDIESNVREEILSENPCASYAQEIIIRRGPAAEQIHQCIEQKSIDFLVLGFSHPSLKRLRTTLYRTVAAVDVPVLCIPVD
jgi:nucleotide-binding universal stress UspA family protein